MDNSTAENEDLLIFYGWKPKDFVVVERHNGHREIARITEIGSWGVQVRFGDGWYGKRRVRDIEPV